jgi:hypothetical protein
MYLVVRQGCDIGLLISHCTQQDVGYRRLFLLSRNVRTCSPLLPIPRILLRWPWKDGGVGFVYPSDHRGSNHVQLRCLRRWSAESVARTCIHPAEAKFEIIYLYIHDHIYSIFGANQIQPLQGLLRPLHLDHQQPELL